jgi:hypothetical protein
MKKKIDLTPLHETLSDTITRLMGSTESANRINLTNLQPSG